MDGRVQRSSQLILNDERSSVNGPLARAHAVTSSFSTGIVPFWLIVCQSRKENHEACVNSQG